MKYISLASLRFRPLWLILAGLSLVVLVGIVTWQSWWPAAQQWLPAQLGGRPDTTARQESSDHGHDHHEHDGHDHDHHGHDHHGHDHGDEHDHGDHTHTHNEADALQVSTQAMGNIGLTPDMLQPIQLQTYYRSITVPGIIVERPGRTRIEVSTPMAGVITHVHAVQGEAITPGSLMFELRITAEELVSTQTALLTTVGELDVENREIARLQEVTRSGAVPQKALLERQYAKDKLEVLLTAQREALRLQGLSEEQIDEMVQNRRLFRNLQIVAPGPDEHSHDEQLRLTRLTFPTAYQQSEIEPPEAAEPSDTTPLILQEVLVHKGEGVEAGATLAVVSDMSELYIEGRAFQQDVELISQASANGWTVEAIFERAGQQHEIVADLELLYSANVIDVDSRTLKFFVRLPNEIVRQVPSPNGQTFVQWRYLPGQRLQLRVPVEQWQQQIVLPVDAVAQEGAESFVFLWIHDHFDRVPVRVLHRDRTHVVVDRNGALSVGDVVALRGAHQMQMALKNKTTGGVDPHAGHTH